MPDGKSGKRRRPICPLFSISNDRVLLDSLFATLDKGAMNPRQKCAQCGTVADFHDEFCTSCWSHRTKGKVLSSEQIATCEAQYAAVKEKKRWHAELGAWQNRLLLPSILMTLWCLFAVSTLLPVCLKYGEGRFELGMALLCAASFAIGGYLVGGSKALRIACPLLIIASLAATYHIGEYLLEVMRGEAELGKGFVFSSIRLVFCGAIVVSSVQILRLKRPAA